MAYSAFGINYGTAAQIQSFRGDDAIPAQPIWAEDTHQLWIVHGTQGKYRIAMADEMSAYLTTANASATYLAKSDASNTYLTQANAATTYLSKADAGKTYMTITTANSSFATKAEVQSVKDDILEALRQVNAA